MDNSLVQNCMMYIALHELRRLLNSPERIPMRVGGEAGSQWVHRLLNGHPNLCKEQLRLDKQIFINLVNVLTEKQLICDGRFVLAAEQVAICLYLLAKADSYRDAAERFQHSTSTICKYHKSVLQALVALSKDLIRPFHSLNDTPTKIVDNPLYWPFFKDCIGAIDGTHVQAVVGGKEAQPFIGRSGTKSWNVLACVSFDMLFTYVCVGFEGSAHDSRILNHCLSNAEMGFPHPPEGKYYLVDSGFPNSVGYLSPHQGQGLRVHTPEFRNGPPPEGKFEHFNYRHSSLRGTVERIFGVLKNRWKVLRMMPKMDETYQLATIIATCTLHNFIRLHDLRIPIDQVVEPIEARVNLHLTDQQRKNEMKLVRDKITDEIWSEVCEQNDMHDENEDHQS